MKKIINLLGLSLISIMGTVSANETVGEVKSTATMQATCSISANQIGFGAISAPLLAQTAQSEMSVKCSNASAYTIDLAYGGIYGTGSHSSDSGYTVDYWGTNAINNLYYIYDYKGVNLGYISCGYAGTALGNVYFQSDVIANLYGYTKLGHYKDTNGTACVSNNTNSGTYPVGWKGSWNQIGKQSIITNTGYSYGVMSGISKGDKLAYSIQVPGDVNKVWNSGANAYKSTGNGEFQTIPLNGKIVVDKSSSKYLAPDMYMDTITAVISY